MVVELPIKRYWWGYKHTNGSYQAKPYDPIRWGESDMQDARESDFVDQVVGPFEIPSDVSDIREYALNKIKELTR